MLYYLLRALFRITNKFYFSAFQVRGIENIPQKGPVFIIANHPSGWMDPLVIGTITSRRLYFLAKGALFESSFAQWLLPKLNMIPIFRSHETPGQGKKNREIFTLCYRHLAMGGAILAFPEGISLTERTLKKIQSGTARICLGAEAANNFSLNIKIVAVGLNYSNPHKFYSEVFINIAQAINVSDYFELYKQDAFKGAHALTDEIARCLEKQIVALKDAQEDALVANIEELYKSELLLELSPSTAGMKEDFEATLAIRDTLRYFEEHEPDRVKKLKETIESYLQQLQTLQLSDGQVKGVEKRSRFWRSLFEFIFLLLGFPLFVFGFLNNFLPYHIPAWSARFISKRPEYYGSIAFTLGTLTFIFFYTLQIWLVQYFLNDWKFTLLYFVVLPLSGLFSFIYYRRFKEMQGRRIILTLLSKKSDSLRALISKRQQIIDELRRGKEDFIKLSDQIQKI